jgi:glycosyltransferase involved in cell wall biosynthesis
MRSVVEHRAAKLSGKINVQLTGWIDREQIAELLRHSDIYLSASSDEGVSNSILEAMASGVVPVVSDIEGHRDVIENGVEGLLCDTPAAIADALKQMEDPTVRNRFQQAALKKAQSMSWAATAQQLGDLAMAACTIAPN